jgi:SAM-dependent methyltransferase
MHIPPQINPGQLARIQQQHGHDLRHVDMHSLLIELWNRLQRGDAVATTSEMISVGDAVCEDLTAKLDIHNNRFARVRFFDLFGMFQHDLPHPRPPIAGASYLDLGCGSINPFGWGLLMCMLGATSCACLDLEDIQDPARAARGLARMVDIVLRNPSGVVRDYPITRAQIDRNLEGIDVEGLRRGDLSAAGPRLPYLKESAAKTSLADASVHVATSNSFLEHLDDVDAVFAELARITAKGGFGVHAVDGIDHWSYGDPARGPHDFLWDPTPGMVHGSNRIRPLEFPALFERHGFSVQAVIPRQTIPMTDSMRKKLLPRWASMSREMLETTQITLVVRRT